LPVLFRVGPEVVTGGYILRRCLAGLVTLLVASFLVFLLVAVSGDPLANLEANPHISHATTRAAFSCT
jgi:ABC-type dipeptide/oligopeptide/nickel transport system permease component